MATVAADSTALHVVHTIGVEGHLPVPGTIVLRGRRHRPQLLTAVATPTTATLTDLKGGASTSR